MKRYVLENKQKSEFSVNRKVFSDQEILESERKEIFSKCWLYIGHESELPKNGDYKRKKVGGEIYYLHGEEMGESELFIILVHIEGPWFAEKIKGIQRCSAVSTMLGALIIMGN